MEQTTVGCPIAHLSGSSWSPIALAGDGWCRGPGPTVTIKCSCSHRSHLKFAIHKFGSLFNVSRLSDSGSHTPVLFHSYDRGLIVFSSAVFFCAAHVDHALFAYSPLYASSEPCALCIGGGGRFICLGQPVFGVGRLPQIFLNRSMENSQTPVVAAYEVLPSQPYLFSCVAHVRKISQFVASVFIVLDI